MLCSHDFNNLFLHALTEFDLFYHDKDKFFSYDVECVSIVWFDVFYKTDVYIYNKITFYWPLPLLI